jgi:transposase InsO family protein
MGSFHLLPLANGRLSPKAYLGLTPSDGCTRQVVGYAIADHMRVDLALAALDLAVTNRRPPPGGTAARNNI